MFAVFVVLHLLYGGARRLRSLLEIRSAKRRRDGNVESVRPVPPDRDVDVSWSALGVWNK